MKLTEEQIKEINSKCPYDQGIFRQPNYISTDIKEPVIFSCWESQGRPGSCWDDEDTVNETYYNDKPYDHMKVLDLTLEILKPDISDLNRRLINGLIRSDDHTESGYYGDYSTYTAEYIILSELEEFLLKI